jgi:hypothetical protein
MQARRHAAIFVGLAVFGASIAVLIWPSHCPVRLGVVRMEPSGIWDETDQEYMLTYIPLSNRSGVPVVLQADTIEVEVRVGNAWMSAEIAAPVIRVSPRSTTEMAILMPRAAGAYRMRFSYDYRPRSNEVRWSDWAWRHVPRLYRMPILGPFLTSRYYSSRLRQPLPPRWRSVLTKEIDLPRRPESAINILNRAHNHPASGKAGITSPLTIEHHPPGLPEPGRYPEPWNPTSINQVLQKQLAL